MSDTERSNDAQRPQVTSALRRTQGDARSESSLFLRGGYFWKKLLHRALKTAPNSSMTPVITSHSQSRRVS
jgi:hypothetical protein